MMKKIQVLALFSLIFVLSASQGFAQNANPAIDILPAKSLSGDSMYVTADDVTHPPVRLTPDKSEMIRLDREAGSIIIGNPAHISILADSAKTLVLVPQQPGASHFTVLDRRGDVLMQRHVIVASPKEKYIRIRRSCAGSTEECQATSVYYCPDMCHEIAIPSGAQSGGSGALEEAAAAGIAPPLEAPTGDEEGSAQ